MTNVSLQSFSFSFSLQVMKAPALTSNNSVWELTSKTTINCNPVKSPLSQLLISRVLLPALALWMGLVKCYWRWMGSGCCGSRVLKVALMHPSLPRPPSSSSIPNTLLILHLWRLKGNITAAETFRFFSWSNAFYPLRESKLWQVTCWKIPGRSNTWCRFIQTFDWKILMLHCCSFI